MGKEYEEPKLDLFAADVDRVADSPLRRSGRFTVHSTGGCTSIWAFMTSSRTGSRLRASLPRLMSSLTRSAITCRICWGRATRSAPPRAGPARRTRTSYRSGSSSRPIFWRECGHTTLSGEPRSSKPGDIDSGLRAASAIGDDRLQMETQGYVVPDSFTHGTSRQRVRWFRKGFDTGDINQGDTFSADDL